MTVDIKKTWFYANYNKPKRMKRIIKKYMKKSRNVITIINNSDQYYLDIPKEYADKVRDKHSFYNKQSRKLESIRNAFLNGNMEETNKAKIIDEVFNGKYIWRESKSCTSAPTVKPKEGILTKIVNKLFH